jgi:hypothetical protein
LFGLLFRGKVFTDINPGALGHAKDIPVMKKNLHLGIALGPDGVFFINQGTDLQRDSGQGPAAEDIGLTLKGRYLADGLGPLGKGNRKKEN